MSRALLGLTLTLALATASVFIYSTEETESGPAFDGLSLFHAKGCVGCHLRGDLGQFQIGPNLTGLASWAGTRVEGLGAEEYIRQSITEPQAYLVSGYQGIEMPTLSLSDTEVDALLEFLLDS